MVARLTTILATLALVVAACGDDGANSTTTRPAAVPTTATTAAGIPTTTGPRTTTGPPTTRPQSTTVPLPGSDGPTLLRSDLDRLVADLSPEDRAALTSGGRDFGADLFGVLATGDGNLAISPTSIRLALAMATAGAGGDTGTQLRDVLGFSMPADRLDEAINALDTLLASRNVVLGEGEYALSVRLAIANALWAQTGFPIEDAYLAALAQHYGAGLNIVDFVTAAEDARKAINAWVADATEARITDLVPEGALDALTRLVLTNAVYVDADWARPFDAAATAAAPFTLIDGSIVDVEMMRQQATLAYAAGNGWQAVRLPYAGNELGMVLVVPDQGRYVEVEASLGAGLLDDVRAQLGRADVALGLPKFEFRAQTGLDAALKSLGIVDAFSGDRADFNGISPGAGLFISDVIHEVFIRVDEKGTEAAAATAVIIRTTGALPKEPISLTIDRPFIFGLDDLESGELLFLGRVLDPTA